MQAESCLPWVESESVSAQSQNEKNTTKEREKNGKRKEKIINIKQAKRKK